MDRNRWETAIRCLEAALRPGASNDEVVAAVDLFRRAAGDTPLSRVCVEFACGGMPLADLAQLKEALDRLNRENLDLRSKLAAEQSAQAGTARRLDAAYRRIYELTEEALAAQRLAEAARREFEDFRATYAKAESGNAALRAALDAARPFGAFLAEAREAADEAAAVVGEGTGSGRLMKGAAR